MTSGLRWAVPALVVAACVGYLIYSASGGSAEHYLTVSELRSHADSGNVRVAGAAIALMSQRDKIAYRRANIGFVFQQYNLLPALTAAENVAVPLVAAGATMAQALRRADPLIERLGLGEHRDVTSGRYVDAYRVNVVAVRPQRG